MAALLAELACDGLADNGVRRWRPAVACRGGAGAACAGFTTGVGAATGRAGDAGGVGGFGDAFFAVGAGPNAPRGTFGLLPLNAMRIVPRKCPDASNLPRMLHFLNVASPTGNSSFAPAGWKTSVEAGRRKG